MIRRNSFYLLLLFVFLFASCEKSINVTPPPFTSTLVVISESYTGGPITAYVGKSLSIAEHKNHPNLLITNATVKLFAEEEFKQDMVYDSTLGQYVSSVVAEPNKKYTIKVSAPGYADATSEIVAQPVVSINSIARTRNARIDADKNYQDEIIFTFTDPPHAGNYYLVKISQAADTSKYYTMYGFCVNTIDASVENESNENIDITTCVQSNAIFVRDELFNGSQKQLKLYVNSMFLQPQVLFGDSTYPVVELYHVSEAYFKFEKSRIVASYTNGDPFAEPVNVYSNVKKGYGIFAINGWDWKEIK